MERDKIYLAIDLKAFYASVECCARGWDPLNTNLVVADQTRTDKTICLAVSPALKAFGIKGRPRLFAVKQAVATLNRERAQHATCHHLSAHKSVYRQKLLRSPDLRIDFKIVPPRMKYYLQKSAAIYGIYLRFLPADKIHVYSIDEVFLDVSDYLVTHDVTAHQLARLLIKRIYQETGLTATAGIGTNLYLAKVALDIGAKHVQPDSDGVRIAFLDEKRYRCDLWDHQPLTDFWRIGRGYAQRLQKLGLVTMRDIAQASLGTLTDQGNADLLFKEFGINAELLIDHAWGKEATTMADIKHYHPAAHGFSTNQILPAPTPVADARLTLGGMIDNLVQQLVRYDLLTDQISLGISYDQASLNYYDYQGELSQDFYGRIRPKSLHIHTTLAVPTAAASDLRSAFHTLFDQHINSHLLVRRIMVGAGHLQSRQGNQLAVRYEQTNLFVDPLAQRVQEQYADYQRERDHRLQQAILTLQQQYNNKNIVIRLADILPGARTKERNLQIGGHRA
ncbi:LytTR family transcriptional regulator [Ligilactobacillus saerimneri]|uniref:Y-family DNA polymerase n=1 Tax=Ligilactobacillus saerimneri TaxID=228229 RepID=UPI0003FB949E|nr:LytTR family transcriptional regulator [Ligilactobacillus saerimneri]KRL74735.1 UV-damage repair protein [Ligilactobacillus saerimneri DSM 16049]MCZ0892162.1 LytTR family transcriptional regulator [Ligilactobacillus saerimneri]